MVNYCSLSTTCMIIITSPFPSSFMFWMYRHILIYISELDEYIFFNIIFQSTPDKYIFCSKICRTIRVFNNVMKIFLLSFYFILFARTLFIFFVRIVLFYLYWSFFPYKMYYWLFVTILVCFFFDIFFYYNYDWKNFF